MSSPGHPDLESPSRSELKKLKELKWAWSWKGGAILVFLVFLVLLAGTKTTKKTKMGLALEGGSHFSFFSLFSSPDWN